jgi:tRNA uridine 5-carbamoylmethylation protein Kti12
MNISENILKNSLKNVYFLIGTPCGGKTTMAKELSKKYGFIRFCDNWHEENFKVWESIIDPKYQKKSSQKPDWEAYFSRTAEEYLAERNQINEYIEFAIIELIKLSQNNKVIADMCAPIGLISEISDYNRTACLLAPADLVIRDYYGREDHKELIKCIMSLKEPEKKLENQNNLFRADINKTFDDVKKYGLFSVVRNEESTVENTLKILEKHFYL